MLTRLSMPSNQQSFFLFGARGTGKSTLLKTLPFLKNSFFIDLLKPNQEEEYSLRPSLLEEQSHSLRKNQWIVIDEIQKVPKLLDIVHSLIEERGLKFALTGSSSRKLKRGGGNLLAGRAVIYSLYPISSTEMGNKFSLNSALQWGTLPKILGLSSNSEKARFLRSYVQVYLKEEILVEQLVRNLDPFRLFLPIAAQMDGQIINYSNISKDTGVDHKTIQNYYQILVDTYLGFFLEAYSKSIRKVQIQSPKFYFFDLGVQRALQKKLTLPLEPQTSDYGNAFESWFINECIRLNSYLELDYEFSYLKTKDDVEIDLIIQKPNGLEILIEIKSADKIDERKIKGLLQLQSTFPKAELICASRVEKVQKIQGILVLPWQEALKRIFG